MSWVRSENGYLQLNTVKHRLQSLLEILNSQLLALVMLFHAVDPLGWNQHVANDLNDTVSGDAILDGHLGKAVNPDDDEAAVAGDVNTQ